MTLPVKVLSSKIHNCNHNCNCEDGKVERRLVNRTVTSERTAAAISTSTVASIILRYLLTSNISLTCSISMYYRKIVGRDWTDILMEVSLISVNTWLLTTHLSIGVYYWIRLLVFDGDESFIRLPQYLCLQEIWIKDSAFYLREAYNYSTQEIQCGNGLFQMC